MTAGWRETWGCQARPGGRRLGRGGAGKAAWVVPVRPWAGGRHGAGHPGRQPSTHTSHLDGDAAPEPRSGRESAQWRGENQVKRDQPGPSQGAQRGPPGQRQSLDEPHRRHEASRAANQLPARLGSHGPALLRCQGSRSGCADEPPQPQLLPVPGSLVAAPRAASMVWRQSPWLRRRPGSRSLSAP